ncbi:MAG: hypothetical protein WDO73_07425 [Ignavibacteriota bacterium]
MGTIRAALLLFAAIPSAMLAQAPPQEKSAPPKTAIKCRNVNGQGCTQRQVKALSDAVFEGKSQHDVLLPVKELALASSDGTLRCAQSDGTVCTVAELDIIKQIAATQQLSINYNSAK